MTDLHCHILHDMDDGPAELGESLELCRMAWNNHIEQIVATPHFLDAGRLDDFLSRRAARVEELKAALKLNDVKAALFAGAEVYLTEELLSGGRLNTLTINGSRYLLAELPYEGLSLPQLRKYMAEIMDRGLIPIMAHPERYVCFQRKYELLNELLDRGVLLQVNADSLSRPAKKAEYSLAKEIVKKKAASFLATDAHSVLYRPNNLLDMLNGLPAGIDCDYLDGLVNVNPHAVLEDQVIDTRSRQPITQSRRG